MEKNNSLDLIPYELNKELVSYLNLGNKEIHRALTYKDFFEILSSPDHNRYNSYSKICQSIHPYYVKDKLKFGIKIWNVHGRMYFNCEWTGLDSNKCEKLFFDDLRSAQIQCIGLILKLMNKTYQI